MITQTYLKTQLEYNANTGCFIWLVNKTNGQIKQGTLAGFLSGGYLNIGLNNKTYKLHRLAWLYVYGEWPKNHIDHIDGNKLNNKIDNLRDVTNSQNHQNRKIHRQGKLVGCSYNIQHKKWEAYIRYDGQRLRLGLHATEQEAHAAYLKKKKELNL